MRVMLTILGLAALIAMASSSMEVDTLRSSSAKFSQDLFSVMRSRKENENIVVSPISLQIALAMLYAGAGGNTRTQLAKVLHAESEDVQKYVDSYKELLETLKDPVLSVASTVFVDKLIELHESYTAAVSRGFGANVESVDFSNGAQAAKTINEWCTKNTNGKIKEIFSPDAVQGVVAVLTNAVYFKANWKIKFDPMATRERDFKSPAGVVKVQMMNTKSHFEYVYSEKLQAQVLELPYANEKFRMLIVLPSEGVALSVVENNLKTIGLEEILKGMYSTEVEVFLPKFKIEISIELNEALKQLGASEIFSSSANFTGMTESHVLVSKVKQKVFIEVNEEGTEAAAVTGVATASRALVRPSRRAQFVVDRPFSFLILTRQSTTAIFVGSITMQEDK